MQEIKLKNYNSLFKVRDIFCSSAPWFHFIKDKTQVTLALGDKCVSSDSNYLESKLIFNSISSFIQSIKIYSVLRSKVPWRLQVHWDLFCVFNEITM